MNLYLLDIQTPTVRAKIRQEFERNRYVQQVPVVDMLITKSNMEFQETMNYWKQTAQIMKYFRSEEDPRSHVPKDFMTAFLEVRRVFFFFSSCATGMVEGKLIGADGRGDRVVIRGYTREGRETEGWISSVQPVLCIASYTAVEYVTMECKLCYRFRILDAVLDYGSCWRHYCDVCSRKGGPVKLYPYAQ